MNVTTAIFLSILWTPAFACGPTLFAEYDHKSSVFDGKPFNDRSAPSGNVWSVVYSHPINRWLEIEFGLGFDSRDLYGRDPTGTLRVKVPLWGRNK